MVMPISIIDIACCCRRRRGVAAELLSGAMKNIEFRSLIKYDNYIFVTR
jgi:hypothetical protein